MLLVVLKNDVHELGKIENACKITSLGINNTTPVVNDEVETHPVVQTVLTRTPMPVREEVPMFTEVELMEIADVDAAKQLWIDDFERMMKSISDMWHHLNQDDMTLAKMVSKHTSRVTTTMTTIKECMCELRTMYSTIVSGWWFNRKWEAPEVTHAELVAFVNNMQDKLKDTYSTGDFERGGIDDFAEHMRVRLEQVSMILEGAFNACQEIIDNNIDHVGIDIKQQQVQKMQTVVGMTRTSLKQVLLLLEVDMSKLNEIHNVVVPLLYTRLKPMLAEQVTSTLPAEIDMLITQLEKATEPTEKK